MGNDAAKPQKSTTPSRPGLHRPYRVRVAWKGERSVGKSALIRMLSDAGPFVDVYEPTQQTARSALEWTFKSTNEEVWALLEEEWPVRALDYVLNLDLLASRCGLRCWRWYRR
jgi:hypothetical protein